MDIYQIAFIGHRRICSHFDLEAKIEQIVRNYIKEKDFVECYVGRNGDYDILAASAIKRAQNALGHENSRLILVQPYPTRDDPYYETFYDEICYPIEGTTHPKAAITRRNQWMVDQAKQLIAFVEDTRTGGASAALTYAQQKGVSIINLATQK